MSNIFPKEILEYTQEVHIFTHKVTSKVIYFIILSSVLIAFAATPFINLDIYSSSTGMLKPEKERHQITSLFGGLVKDVRIRENQLVSENDTLVVIDPSIVVEKRNLNLQKLEETRLYIHDLNYLINHSRVVLDSLKHFNYQKGYLQFKEKIHELNTKLNKSRIDYERQSKLYEKDVIPKVEYQENKYSLEMITSELSYFKKQQIQYWQTDLTQYLTVEKELLSSLAQVEKELENYILKSPITGTIQNLIGIGIGSNLSAGNPICEISPETEIIAECYVSPSDIGLLKLNNKTRSALSGNINF